MKKSLVRFLVVGSLALTLACQEDQDTMLVPDQATPQLEKTETLAHIKNLGYDERVIEDLGDYYVVEGDILFYKETFYEAQPDRKLSHSPKNGRSTQYSTGYPVAPEWQQNIAVYVDPAASDWQNAVLASLVSYNSLPDCRLSFTLTANSAVADISIFYDSSLPARTAARATFPYNGRPGFRIQVNPSFQGEETSAEAQRQLIMTHEIGHCLGFRHSNWWQFGEPERGIVNDSVPYHAELIPGTPREDANSIMNADILGDSWSGFSQYDTVALSTLYPLISEGS